MVMNAKQFIFVHALVTVFKHECQLCCECMGVCYNVKAKMFLMPQFIIDVEDNTMMKMEM